MENDTMLYNKTESFAINTDYELPLHRVLWFLGKACLEKTETRFCEAIESLFVFVAPAICINDAIALAVLVSRQGFIIRNVR